MELFKRLSDKPIIMPADVPPSHPGMLVRCVINPGAFVYQGRIGLLMRVCEQPPPKEGCVVTAIFDDSAPDGMKMLCIPENDPKLVHTDPRLFDYESVTYLTTLSHLRLAWSDDGIKFSVEPCAGFTGQGLFERFGVEDCRVVFFEGHFHLTYTAVSQLGVTVAHASTTDFRNFQRHGVICVPHNKDCVLFPGRVDGRYIAVHRPSGAGVGGHNMWISTSPDLVHWGEHRILATSRPGTWDSQRVGVNGPPILTDRGWLLMYHGADHTHHYRFGAMLLDRDDPSKVLARSTEPIFQPTMDYEKSGFFANVVFSNGHVVKGDEVTLYYGAADQYIGAARGSLKAILESLHL